MAAPRIDSRTVVGIERKVRELLLGSLKERYSGVEDSGSLDALIAVFGRYSELVIERLNRSLDKKYLAWLDLLGVSQLPPHSARVPLTFQPAAGAFEPVVVPEGTQVAASPAPGDTEPVIFETERELTVAPLSFAGAYMIDRDRDICHTWRTLAPDLIEYAGPVPIQHVLYLGYSGALELPPGATLELEVRLEKPLEKPLAVEWALPGPSGFEPAVPTSDTTKSLTRDGVITFVPGRGEPGVVQGIGKRWIRATLKTPITKEIVTPSICSVVLRASAAPPPAAPDLVFFDSQPLDLTKDFFPFGPRPVFGSAFLLTKAEALLFADATVTLQVELTNPASGGPEPPIPRVTAVGAPHLVWEFRDSDGWTVFGHSTSTEPKTPQFPDFEDETRAFTQNGAVRFRLPSAAMLTKVNGADGRWIRVRLEHGNYGTDVVLPGTPAGQPTAGRNPLAPPSVRTLRWGYKIDREVQRPEVILNLNEYEWKDDSSAAKCFQPFHAATTAPFNLFLGLVIRSGAILKRFGSSTLSIYSDTRQPGAEGLEAPSTFWQYWNGSDWNRLGVLDETRSFTRPGVIRILPPQDAESRERFGINAYWARVTWPDATPPIPAFRHLSVNTVFATHSVTIEGETLGGSNGEAGQTFRALHAPMLSGMRLEVMEGKVPTAADRTRIEAEEGADAIRVIETVRNGSDVWVRWHETPDFYQSERGDRHYVADHVTGEIRFGDNVHGRIPPEGKGNIRLASYRTGGGSAGNRDVGRIAQLKTTVPYIAGATNYEPSRGGVDAEDERELHIRGPRIIRHRDRAVTREDFEDLAMTATPQVARARCIPLHDLESAQPLEQRPGTLSVIIVPRSTEPRPVPDDSLRDIVYDFLDARRSPVTKLAVVGPYYIHIDVEADIVIDPETSGDVEARVLKELDSFLHPLTGGGDGLGWRFGRRVHRSDLYRVIDTVPGISYIARLNFNEVEETKGVGGTSVFLICSGNHRIRLSMSEDQARPCR